MSAFGIVALAAGASASVVSVIGFMFSRWLRRAENRAEIRDNAIAIMVQHFDEQSELSIRTGGTLPDKVYATLETNERIEQAIAALDGENTADRLAKLEQIVHETVHLHGHTVRRVQTLEQQAGLASG